MQNFLKLFFGQTCCNLQNNFYFRSRQTRLWISTDHIDSRNNFFGFDSFGWRIAVALLGIAAVMLVHRVGRRLFHNELVAWLAGLFMAVDGLAIVLSRTALLDQTLMFFTLAGFAAIVADRDRARRRLEAGRPLGFRWHLMLATLLLGLALGTKWSAAWFIVACGLLAIFFIARIRNSLGDRRAWLHAIWFDTLPYLPLILVILGGTYLVAWSGWLDRKSVV